MPSRFGAVRSPRPVLVLACWACALAGGCGSSSTSGGAPSSTAASTAGGAGALSAEARSAATGDIPDNQVFLLYTTRSPRYSIKYPEGWTQSGSPGDVTFRDKNNVVHVVVEPGPAPTAASVAGHLQTLKASTPTLTFTAPRLVNIGGAPVVKATYATKSAPDPVTGRTVLLTVDRYVLGHGRQVATVDLGTPQGVDNVDAYRMMIESFRWG
jgi:hypothetical protein